MNHYPNLGIYVTNNMPWEHYGYVMDDMGNLAPINEDQFDQLYYFRTGKVL